MIYEFIEQSILSSVNILNGSSSWLIISFLIAGTLKNLVSPEKFQKMLGNKKFSSILKSIFSSLLLPVCSCGTFPLAISMYYSGAYLGPTLAFLTANPVMNPIAIILCYGLLGPKLTVIYIITGLTLAIIVGIVANNFSGSEVCLYNSFGGQGAFDLEEEKPSIIQKIKRGINWAFTDLAMVVSKYVVLGMVLAGFILTIAQDNSIQKILGDPSMISLGGVAILAGIMYVCAVGHIPFIAALIATGVAPGVAITFLMAGAATNLPELLSLYKIIGKKAVLIYFSIITGGSLIGGYVANMILLPNFKPVMDFDKVNHSVNTANKFIITFPDWMKIICTIGIVVLGIIAIWKDLGIKYLNHKMKVEK